MPHWLLPQKFSAHRARMAAWGIAILACLACIFAAASAETSADLLLEFTVALIILCAIACLYALSLMRHIANREEELTDLRTDFIAVASHELRSPLAAVRWYLAELRGNANLSQDARSVVNELYERICALIDLTTTFFLMTSADRTPIRLASVKTANITPMVHEAVTHALAGAHTKRIKLQVEGLSDAPIVLHADLARLRIAFDNLLSNAIKYSREGSIVIFAYKDFGRQHQFSVNDHGIGVPPEEISKIFLGFHRASNAVRSGALGSGFGLFMTKKIIEMHDGDITCQSNAATGTTFTITLPAAE